jgi:hypothetical protein
MSETKERFTPGPWECKEVKTQVGRAFRIGKGAMLEPGLIEAVARALFDTEWRGLRPDIRPTFGRDESDRQYWIDSARAALLAIEGAGYAITPVEPTNEMLAEGRKFAVPATQSIAPIYAALLSSRPRVT